MSALRRAMAGIATVAVLGPGLAVSACTVHAPCEADRYSCDGDDSTRCRPDGLGHDVVDTCEVAVGEFCIAATGRCNNPCEVARAATSYIGCEYWAVPALNAGLDRARFHFAVAVANPEAMPATVTITRGTETVAVRTVDAGRLETIELPWMESLESNTESSLVRDGAYRIRSNLPVAAYQFNPLEYTDADGTFSFSNDASLLLPTHVLTGSYMVMARATLVIEQVDEKRHRSVFGFTPGFATIVGAGTTVATVSVEFSSDVLASTDGSVRAFVAGETGSFELGPGDVLQLLSGSPPTCVRSGTFDTDAPWTSYHYCTVGPEYDLTGTVVRATGPVAVFAGHDCAFVPFDRWACDHLEEVMIPLEAWGDEAIVSITEPIRGEPNVIRVLSSHDRNALTFDPPEVHSPVVLGRGEYVEFGSTMSFHIAGSDAIAVGQFLVGQDIGGYRTGADGVGDPSFSLAIPTAQFRTRYAFLAAPTYTTSYVNITAPLGAVVVLDGIEIAGLEAVGGTGFGVARIPLPGGAHTITGDQELGIVVYAYGDYTSYMYPGGLDLEVIDVPF